MSIQCVSETCDYPIQDGWDFCPMCGVDNRMPSHRKPIPYHHHTFIHRQSGYCTRCGEPAGEPYNFNYKWRVRLMMLALLSGLTSLAGAGIIQLGRHQSGSALGRWVNSWYSIPVEHRRSRRYSYQPYTTELGYEWTVWLCVFGAGFIVVGLMLLFKMPFSSDDDDSGIWGGRWRTPWW